MKLSRTLRASFALALFVLPLFAQADLPEDIHFLAEHAAEASQDARYYALPWPDGDLEAGRWCPFVSIGGARVDAAYARAEGALALVGVEHAWSARWGVELFGFHDELDVSGGESAGTIRAFALSDVPLDLPARAVFSRPSGRIDHDGAGAIFVRQLSSRVNGRVWSLTGGVLVERLDLSDFGVDYRLLDGTSAGVEGRLDHSGSVTLVTWLLGVQRTQPIGSRFRFSPRAAFGAPFAPGDMTTRLTGPGFDLTTSSTGARPGQIGDAFFVVGASLRDMKSGFGVDLGASIVYPAFETFTHPGIRSAVMLAIDWRSR